MVRRETSLVVYRGPSAYDGSPIVGIITGLIKPSDNAKTGPMAQLHILVQGEAPHVAQRTGADRGVCGDCAFRPVNVAPGAFRCYVKTWRGTRGAWKANKDKPERLRDACDALRHVRGLRLGSYGDPYALPEHVVASLVGASHTHTGYTHAWQRGDASWLQPYCMASVETELDAWRAWGSGWRTFRTTTARSPRTALPRIEVVCPHETHGTQCVDCGLCNGSSTARSVTIPLHR